MLKLNSFSKPELERIIENPEGVRFLWFSFLDDALEQFHSLCELLSKGKGFCDGSVEQRKSAVRRLFASFAGITLNNEELPLNVAISYVDVAAGLQTLTEKWSEYSSDVLLSVSLLLDLSGEGSVSYEDFLRFSQLANESLNQDPDNPRECIDTFYDCLRDRIRESISGKKICFGYFHCFRRHSHN